MIDREATERPVLVADQPRRPAVTPADDDAWMRLDPGALCQCQWVGLGVTSSSSRCSEERQTQHPEPKVP
jgi:hypothetical protein